MSRELTEQQSQPETAAPGAQTSEDIEGLPPHLYGQIVKLGPGDVDGLVYLLKLHGEMSPKILAVASRHLPMSTVKRAMGAADRNGPARAPELQQADTEQLLWGLESDAPVHAMRDDVYAQVMALQPGDARGLMQLLQLHPTMSDAILTHARRHLGVDTVARAVDMKQNPESDAGSQQAQQAQAAPSAAWIAGARAYNDAHPSFASEFNELTLYMCQGDGSTLDPQSVADWQRKHGLDADGKVGPRTVAAARETKARTSVAQGAQTDARIPV